MASLQELNFILETFELQTGLRLTVHDLCGRLRPHLAPERTLHSSPCCRPVKLSALNERCIRLEVAELRADLPTLAEGRFHVCHAGFVEWVAMVLAGEEVAAILFAGQRLPGKDLKTWRDLPPSGAAARLPRRVLPTGVEQEEALRLREMLLQLAARLEKLLAGECRSAAAAGRPGESRSSRLTDFIRRRHTEPVSIADLATEINVSPGRAAHLVRELTGQTFARLLREERLKTAARLLRATDLPVEEVAYRCGMADLSHFHRYFKIQTGWSPRQFRRQQEQ